MYVHLYRYREASDTIIRLGIWVSISQRQVTQDGFKSSISLIRQSRLRYSASAVVLQSLAARSASLESLHLQYGRRMLEQKVIRFRCCAWRTSAQRCANVGVELVKELPFARFMTPETARLFWHHQAALRLIEQAIAWTQNVGGA
jgi:hypothetical protein